MIFQIISIQMFIQNKPMVKIQEKFFKNFLKFLISSNDFIQDQSQNIRELKVLSFGILRNLKKI